MSGTSCMPTEHASAEQLRAEFQAKLDAHRQEVGFQVSGIERWIQTASTALDKVVELQVQIHTARESQLIDRGVNDEFRRELKDDMKEVIREVGEVKTQSAVNAIKVSAIVGAGMVFLNVVLWAAGRFMQ